MAKSDYGKSGRVSVGVEFCPLCKWIIRDGECGNWNCPGKVKEKDEG